MTFTPVGQLVPVRSLKPSVPRGAKKATIDGRAYYKLTYKTTEVAAKALIECNDKLLLAGGQGVTSIRFEQAKGVLEAVGPAVLVVPLPVPVDVVPVVVPVPVTTPVLAPGSITSNTS